MTLNPKAKKITNVLLIDSILIILGIVCFIAPNFGQSVFNIVLGCILIVIGITNFAFGVSMRDIGITRTIISTIFIALGILVCFNNKFINTFIVVFIGLIALFQAMRECVQGFILRNVAVPFKEYVFYYINALVLLGLSILLFIDASSELMLRMYVLGLAFLYYGVTDIVDLFIALRNDSIEKSLKRQTKKSSSKDKEESTLNIDPSKIIEVEIKEDKDNK